MNREQIEAVVTRYKERARSDFAQALLSDVDAPVSVALLFLEGSLYGHLTALGVSEAEAEVEATDFYSTLIGEWHQHIATPGACPTRPSLH